MFIARKIKEENIYILSYINRQEQVHCIIYWLVYILQHGYLTAYLGRH